MNGLIMLLADAAEETDKLSLLLQYAVYVAVIVVGIVVLGLIKRKQKPVSHEELRRRLVGLSENIRAAIDSMSAEKYSQHDFLRTTQKLIFAADKLIYQASVLADKERDSAISNISVTMERAKSMLMEFRSEWKVSDSGIETEKLSEASAAVDQAVASIDRILERDRLLSDRRVKKNG